jgi:hypothetical protein
MKTETMAVASGVVCGAMLLVLLYVLAARKAATTGQHPVVLYLWVLSLFAVGHGIVLAVSTPLVFVGSTLFGQLPQEDWDWMWYVVRAGVVFILVGGGVLLSLRGRWRPRPVPGSEPRPGGP